MTQYPQWPPAPAYQQPTGPSKSMAITALAMSLAFCVPVLPVVAIVLAVIVLVRGRPGTGRGLAVASLVIAPLALAPVVLFFTTGGWQDFKEGVADGVEQGLRGPEGERDATGRITDRSQVGVDNLVVGDCVLKMQLVEDLGENEAPLGEVTAVPCSEPHRSEVYAVYPFDPDGYDDQQALDRAAVSGCLPGFRDYVGVPYRRSQLEIVYFSPDLRHLAFAEDTVICVVTDPRAPSARMLAGSRR